MNYKIREIRKTEYGILENFLYEAYLFQKVLQYHQKK